MCVLHYIVIILNIADAITPASSAKLAGIYSQDGETKDGSIPKNLSPNEKMTVPRVLQKSASDSSALSFAFTLPVQHKTLPFKPNAPKKQFHPPLKTLTGMVNVKQNRLGNNLKKIVNGQRRGIEMGVKININANDGKTFELVGVPLAVSVEEKGGNKINKSVGLARDSTKGRFGAYDSSKGKPNIKWKARPLAYDTYNGMSPVPQFKHELTAKGNTPLDEDIIALGAPLIFRKQSKQVSDFLKHTEKDGNASYGILNGNTSKEDMHNTSTGRHFQNVDVSVEAQVQGERVQGAKVASKSSYHVDVHNKTAIINYTGVQQLFHVPKNNLSNNYLAEDNHNHGNNQQPNQWPTQQINASQDGRQEKIDGYDTEDITNYALHNTDSSRPASASSGEESLQHGTPRPPFQTTEQSQTEVYNEDGQGPNDSQDLERPTNATNYQDNDAKEHYDNQEHQSANTDQFGDDEENPSAFQVDSAGPKEEEQMDHSQSISDDSNNIEQQDQEQIKEDEQFAGNPSTQFAGNPSIPVSNQRYMPVDEFGSPFYGNETDFNFQREALAAHNRYRAIHRAPPLELNQQLSTEATHFAKQLAELGVARHEVKENLRKEGEGDNVARGCSEWGGLTASGAVHRWYTQVCYYDWNKRTIQPNSKNFMHLIWKGTSRVGIGRAFGMRRGLPCTFVVARYRPGVMNAFEMGSNIDKGLFLPSYCNADRDEGLMSTGYPSSFFLDSITKQNDESIHDSHSLSSSQNTAGLPAVVTYLPSSTWEKNIDAQDMRDILTAPNSFLPRVQLDEGRIQDDVSMVVDDNAWKRDYKEPKGKSGAHPNKHNNRQ